MGYDPNFPTFKHSDKFESRAMVKMMQKEATLAERAWEERTSQRDNNKVYFNHLTRDEAEIEMKIRMDKYQPDKEDDFSYSGNSLKIGTFLSVTLSIAQILNNWNEFLAEIKPRVKKLERHYFQIIILIWRDQILE